MASFLLRRAACVARLSVARVSAAPIATRLPALAPLQLTLSQVAAQRFFSTKTVAKAEILKPSDTFIHRHIGPDDIETAEMLKAVGVATLQELVESTVPKNIQLQRQLEIGEPRGERELLMELKSIASQNKINKSYIGMGYYDTIVPPVILRNLMENPAWYTSYTPYQAEISQGRLESLLNFQTMVSDLTGMDIANASLLDESTAAAEAMFMCHSIMNGKRNVFFVAEDCHPQNIAVVKTRAEAIGVEIKVGNPATFDFVANEVSGVLLQYPNTFGSIKSYAELAQKVHATGAKIVVATDLMALTQIQAPGAWGADICVGSAQRFGVPMGYGGPHAAFFAVKDEFKRKMPGRVIGVSRDSRGKPALRMAMQTREQHIRRDKATSNICTAQALLANMAAMYSIYHGPEGLKRISTRIHAHAAVLAEGLKKMGFETPSADSFFDTITVKGVNADSIIKLGHQNNVNMRKIDAQTVGLSTDETTTTNDVQTLFSLFATANNSAKLNFSAESLVESIDLSFPASVARTTPFLTHPIFSSVRCETDMLRYLYRLQMKDLSLATSMIPLGSCTMKLNGTSEMIPVTWPEFGNIHPFAPLDQAVGYTTMLTTLSNWLSNITGFAHVSLQPNSGAQGEYAGLLAIRAFHKANNEAHRNVCLIPTSAHGTNPASAVLAGMRVVVVSCDENGNVNVDDLRTKAEQHKDNLSCLMITYPSTHGVFEETIRDICNIIHTNGGQVYMDGANMNAQVGLCSPGDIGADVCHLNLHKTFCIPHGGGGPGMGPIGVAKHLVPHLPAHPVVDMHALGGTADRALGTVSAAPWGSASILPISYVYIALMGSEGLKRATQYAILNANYMAARLKDHYTILYTGRNGRVAHEFIIDLREFKTSSGVTEEDVAKRLMDYGFHGPTMSWPVAGTLMIEPTESEPKAELDRLVDALIMIRQEIRDVQEGRLDAKNNPLKNAPHTLDTVLSSNWNRPYSREKAAFPAPWVHTMGKFWPTVGRIDNVYGDRNLVCTCPPLSAYEEEGSATTRVAMS